MMRNSNVFELKPKAQQSDSAKTGPKKAIRLPPPLAKLRVRCGTHLKKLMTRFFERIDDTFFDLADQAASNSEQSSYFDAMREIRMKKGAIANTFLASYQRDFEFDSDILQNEKAAEFDTQNLAVIQNDELEEQVAIENIISRIKSEVGQDLDHLTQRFDALLPSVTLRDENNPVGAHRLANNFAEACQLLELDIRSKLVLYKIFEKQVLSQVKSLLAAANKYLAEQGVLPDLSVVRKTPGQYPKSYQQAPANQRQEHVIDAQTGDISNAQDNLGSDQMIATQPDPLAIIAEVQARMPAFNPEGISMSLPVLRQPSLMNALSVAQNAFIRDVGGNSNHSMVPVNDVGLIDFAKLMQRMMKGKDGNPRARIDQGDQDAINLVSMLFDFILEDRQLQAPIKAILGRLQIPLVKVALVDSSFFKQGGHIARRLLNEFAMASVGWTEKEAGAKDNFIEKLENSVLKIVNEFNDDISIFQEVLNDFQLFQEAEKKRRVLVEQRIRDSEEGRAKAEAAKRYVQGKLNELLVGREPPAFVLNLLREGWSSYMVLLRLKHGAEHADLAEAERTAALLINAAGTKETAEPLTTDGVDELVSTVKRGLIHAAYLPLELDKHMDKLHAYLLANTPKQPAPAEVIHPSANCPIDEVTHGISSETLTEELVNSEVPFVESACNSNEQKAANETFAEERSPQKDSVQENSVKERSVQTVAQSTLSASEFLNSQNQNNLHSANINADVEAHNGGSTLVAPAGRTADAESNTAGNKAAENKVDGSKAVGIKKPEEQSAEEMADTGLTTNPKIVLLKEEPEIRAEDLDQRSLALVEKLGIGSWLEIRESEGKHYRCKLAAIISSIDKFIFVNRMGVKVAEKSKSVLVQQVSEGTIQLLDDGLLFDRALESVITNLRK